VPFIAWLLRISRNAALDTMRSRRAVLSDDPRVEGADDLSDRLRSLAVQDALATLPEGQRQVLYMRHVLGASPGEIADRLGKTQASVHGLHHRGRAALRAALSEQECAPSVRSPVAA
jgi:RNA polymerase sigma-70 factor (ECF subfamily)